MNGTELLHRMDLVDAAYIEEAEAPPRKRHIPRLRAAAIAACICLVLGSTAVLAAESLGFRITDMFTSRANPGSDLVESGYDLAADIQVIPIESLSPNMETARQEIVLAFQNRQPYDNWWPGDLQKKFTSAQAAWDYIGCEALVVPSWDLPQQENRVNVIAGNGGKEIRYVRLSTLYQGDAMHIQCSATIWIKAPDEDAILSLRSTEALEFTEETRTNAAGSPYLAIHSTPLKSGFRMADGYMTREGILYRIHIAYREADADLAEGYLAQWADMF